MNNLLIYFLIGGFITVGIIGLEHRGSHILSGLVTLMPVFTLIAYIVIGQSKGDLVVSQHAKFVLFGTIFAWVPFMLTIIYGAPRLGTHKAILCASALFVVFASSYVVVVEKYRYFK